MTLTTKSLISVSVALVTVLALAPGGEARTVGALAGNPANHLFGGCYNPPSNTGCTLAASGAATSDCMMEYWGGVKNMCNQYQHWEIPLNLDHTGEYASTVSIRACQPPNSQSIHCYWYTMDEVGQNSQTIGPYGFSGSSTTCGNITDNNSLDLTVPDLGYLFAVCYMGPNTLIFQSTY